MILTFQGGDLRYQTQYNLIKNYLWQESKIRLSPPKGSDYYIYWHHPDYFAHGGIQLIFDEPSQEYILKNSVFFIDFAQYAAELTSDESCDLLMKLSPQFYLDVYTVLPTLLPDHPQLVMELREDEFIDCILHGRWPCDAGQQVKKYYYRSHLDLTYAAQKQYLNTLKKMKLIETLEKDSQ